MLLDLWSSVRAKQSVMKSYKSTAVAIAAVVGLAACAPVNLLNTVTPSGSFDKAKDVSYGDLDRQKLDIYRPDKPKVGSPVIVFVHGGSWEEGSKDIYKFLADGFAKDGYEIVIPNYRLYPEVVYPLMIEDTAKAIAFTQDRYPDRPLVLIGHSAGAYNVLMAVQKPSFLADAGGNLCDRVTGVVSMAGPTGIIPLDSEPYITIFPDRFTGEDAPLNNVSGPTPPIFFAHGKDDGTVYPQNSQALADKIVARGGKANVKVYDGVNHIEIVQFLSRHFDGKANVKTDIVTYIDGLPKSGNFCQ